MGQVVGDGGASGGRRWDLWWEVVALVVYELIAVVGSGGACGGRWRDLVESGGAVVGVGGISIGDLLEVVISGGAVGGGRNGVIMSLAWMTLITFSGNHFSTIKDVLFRVRHKISHLFVEENKL